MGTKEIAQSYLILKGAKLTKMPDEDKFKIIKVMRELRPIVDKYTIDEKEAIENNCLRELQEEDHEVKFDKLSEEAFGKLIASNDFIVEEMMTLQIVVC